MCAALCVGRVGGWAWTHHAHWIVRAACCVSGTAPSWLAAAFVCVASLLGREPSGGHKIPRPGDSRSRNYYCRLVCGGGLRCDPWCRQAGRSHRGVRSAEATERRQQRQTRHGIRHSRTATNPDGESLDNPRGITILSCNINGLRSKMVELLAGVQSWHLQPDFI